MNTKAKTVASTGIITTLVGIAAILTFIDGLSSPFVWAEDFEQHKIESSAQFNAINESLILIHIMQTETEIVRLQEKLDSGKGDSQDKLRLMEKERKLKSMEARLTS